MVALVTELKESFINLVVLDEMYHEHMEEQVSPFTTRDCHLQKNDNLSPGLEAESMAPVQSFLDTVAAIKIIL